MPLFQFSQPLLLPGSIPAQKSYLSILHFDHRLHFFSSSKNSFLPNLLFKFLETTFCPNSFSLLLSVRNILHFLSSLDPVIYPLTNSPFRLSKVFASLCFHKIGPANAYGGQHHVCLFIQLPKYALRHTHTLIHSDIPLLNGSITNSFFPHSAGASDLSVNSFHLYFPLLFT